jgi:hypothetical protein
MIVELTTLNLPPLPVWSVADLTVVYRNISRGLKRALIDENFSKAPDLEWEEGLRAFDILHGPLASNSHSFRYPAFSWIRLSEPQVTKAWAHFLTRDDAPQEILHERRTSFLKALVGSPDGAFELPAPGSKTDVATEVGFRVGGRSRSIDLVVEWADSAGRRIALCVEFKFGHHVTKGQLADYRKEMHRRYGGGANVRLVLVLADHASYPSDGRRSRDWKVVKWETLLRRIDHSGGDDGEEYARFRRTVWSRSQHDGRRP